MRLILAATGALVDLDDCKKCPICGGTFLRSAMSQGYCGTCRKHYQRWRTRKVREDRHNLQVSDISVKAFRELYTSGQIAGTLPWTWPGESENPPWGAVIIEQA